LNGAGGSDVSLEEKLPLGSISLLAIRLLSAKIAIYSQKNMFEMNDQGTVKVEPVKKGESLWPKKEP
jgi:hypothetical protein